MTPCNPTNPQRMCSLCLRHQPALPHNAENRPRTVCIDASVIAKPGACPMAVPMQVKRCA